MNHRIAAIEANSKNTDLNTLEESVVFSPSRRMTYPQIVILDDGSKDHGEIFRIRTTQLTLGRVDCDLSFPTETMMSGRHASIVLEQTKTGQWQWVLLDNPSTHGTYLRLNEFPLWTGCQFVIGGTRLIHRGKMVMTGPESHSPVTYEPYLDPNITASVIQNSSVLDSTPYSIDSPKQSIALDRKTIDLGRYVLGQDCFKNDPFIEPIHSKINRKQSKQWILYDNKSLNGVWLRVTKSALLNGAIFMLGEQRFQFILPRTS